MTALATILANLRDEIEAEIRAIAPTRFIDRSYEHFDLFSPNDAQDVIFNQRRPRLFEIGDCEFVDQLTRGNSVDESEYRIPLTFVYPTGEKWGIAAADDIMQIMNYFVDNPSSVTGVSGRWIKPTEKTTTTDNPSDPFRYHTVNLSVWMKVSYS